MPKAPRALIAAVMLAFVVMAGLLILARPGKGSQSRPDASSKPEPAIATALAPSIAAPKPVSSIPEGSTRPVPQATSASASPITRFAAWTTGYVKAKEADRAAMEAQGIELAKARRPVFHELIKADPQEALKQAVPMVTRQQLPESILQHLESRVNGVGVLRFLQGAPLRDEPLPKRSLNFHEAELKGGKTYRAYVYGRRASSTTWVTGASLNGVAVDADFAVSDEPSRTLEIGERPPDTKPAVTSCPVSGLSAVSPDDVPEVISVNTPAVETATEVVYFCSNVHIDLYNQTLIMGEGVSGGAFGFTGILPAAPTPALGVVKVLAIPMSYADQNAIPSTEAQLSATLRDVADFYAKASYGRLTLIGTVSPPVKLKHNEAWYVNRDTSNGGDISGTGVEHAEARDEARKLGYDSNDFDCIVVRHNGGPGSYGGLGGGSSVWARNDAVYLWAHEIGHCFALAHSNFWDTAGTSSIGAGTNQEYGDTYDIMGGANYPEGHYNAQAKNQIKWLPLNFVEPISQSGQYRIYAFDQGVLFPDRRYAMTIVKDAQRTYWGEVRSLYDATNPWVKNGMLLGWRYPNGSGSNLQRIDTSPGSPFSKSDAAISLGTTFSDLESGIHLTTVAMNDSPRYMDVVVNLGQFPGNRKPSLALSASATTVPVGATVTITATASDPDNDPLAYGWQHFGDTTVQLVSGNSPVITRTFSVAGTYVVSCTVSDMKGGTVTRNQLITVGSGNSRSTISGRVTLLGQGLQDVVITANGSNGVVTDADGYYTIPNLSANTYTMTPLLYGYTFGELFNNSITVGPNATGADFEATAIPTVRVDATTSIANEASPAVSGKFTLSRTGDLTQALVVNVNSAQGSATKGTDFNFSPDYVSGSQGFSTFTIPADQSSLDVVVSPINDATIEGPETISLELGPGNGYLVDPQSKATVILNDDESALAKVSTTATAGSATEGSAQPAVVTLIRTSTSGPLTVSYTVGGTAAAGTNFTSLPGTVSFSDGQSSAAIQISPIDNSVSEGLKTVQITLSPNAGYLVDSLASSATINLIDDDVQTLTVTATDASAQEVDLSQSGSVADTGTFVITRSGDTTNPLTVYYAMTGTPATGTAALHGVDYEALPGVLTIPAGASQAAVTITPRYDGFGEGSETVVLLLGAGSTNSILGNPSSASLTITDAPGDKPYLDVVNISSAAEPSTSGTFRITVRGPANAPAIPVNYTLGGTASNGVDYDAGNALWVSKSSGTSEHLRAAWSADSSNVWASGDNGTILKWNGTDWAAQNSGVTVPLRALWGTNTTTVWAVGDNGTILRWNGSAWSAQTSGTTNALRAVWGSSSTSVWAAGDGGVILKFNGISWSPQTSNTTSALRGVWGSDASNVWAVGDGGTVMKFNGTSWSAQSSGVTTTLYAVWGTSATNLWAAGAGGVIRKGTGTSWSSQTSGVTFDLFSLWGADSSNVWVAGAGGGMLRTSNGGTAWSLQVANATQTFNSVRGISVNEVWGFGDGGAAMNVNASVSLSLPGSLVIPPGASSADVTVRPINDTELEALESVSFGLNASASYQTFGQSSSASMWLRDDDQPTVYVDTQVGTAGSITITEGGTGTVKFYISRTGSTTNSLSVDYTLGGTATAGSDYTAVSGTAVIPAGSSGVDVPLTIINDSEVEGTETITFAFAPGAYSRGPGSVMYLADNEAMTRLVGFSSSSSSGTESQTTASIPVTLSSAAATPVTVDYQLAGSNTSSTSVTAGALLPYWVRAVRTGTSIAFFQSVDGATWTQRGSSVTLSGLSTAAYYAGFAVASGDGVSTTATVDNFTVTGLSAGGTTGTQAAVNLGNTTGAHTLNSGVYTVTTPGTGILGSSSSDGVRFIYLPVTNSSNCTVTARLVSLGATTSGARLGVMFRQDVSNLGAIYGAIMHTGSQTLVSGSRASLNAASSSQTAYNVVTLPAWYRLVRSGNTFASSFSKDGSTWYPLGFTQTLALGPTVLAGLAVSSRNDGVLSTATFDNVSLTPAPAGSLQGRTVGFVNVDGSEVLAGGTWTVQGSGSGIGSDECHFVSTEISGDFTLLGRLTALTGGASNAQAGVMARQDRTGYSRSVYSGFLNNNTSEQNYRLQSVTTGVGSGVDFLLPPGTLTFAPGETTKNITFTVIDDNVSEPNDLVSLQLLNPYGAGLSASLHGYTIVDNDSQGGNPLGGFAASGSVARESAGTFPVPVTLSKPASGGVSVNYVVTAGTASAGTDYVLADGSLNFTAGTTVATIPVAITQDSEQESTETFTITLTAPVGITLGSLATHTVSISDDDYPVITVVATDAAASETGPDPGTFTVTRAGLLTGALSVNCSVSGTASNGTDYTSIVSPVVIPDGQASATVTVSPNDDATVEGTETVTLTVSPAAAYVLGAATSATVSIADNDRSTVTIVANDSSASETAGNSGQFTISRTAPSTSSLTVSLSISGTATNGSDYTSIGSTLTFAAGETTKFVNILPIDDTATEGEEVVTLSLGTGSYDVGGSGFASLTIADNDNPPTLFISSPAAQGPLLAERNGLIVGATVSDDGSPQAVTVSWSAVAGSGTATFQSPGATTTGVTFSAPGTYVLRITATDGQFTVSDQCTVVVGTAIVAANWITQDLGPSSSRRGQGLDYAGVYSISGTGAGYASTTSDQAHVMVRSVDGDCSIQARITSLQGTGNPLAGVTIRDAMLRGARRAVLGYVPGSGLQFRTRTTASTNDTTVTQTGIALPIWVKLDRNASTGEITASYASDSSGAPGSWTPIGSPTVVTMDNRSVVGLTTTSNSTSATATSTLDGVSLSPASSAPAFLSEDAAITPAQAGSGTDSGGTYTVAGSSSGYFHGWQFYGDVVITVKHASATSGAGSATSGIRISENLESGAYAHVGRIPTGSYNGFYWRSIAGGSVPGVPSFTGTTRWIRLVRKGNSITAFHAPDVSGSPGTWAQLGQPQTVIMTVPAFVGFWVDNASGVGLNTVTFSSLSILPLNKAPIVDAATSLASTFSPAQLQGTVIDDNLPAPISLTTQWSQVSGPSTVSFANPGALNTSAAFTAPGVYNLRLTANDGSAQTYGDVSFTGVLPAKIAVEQPAGTVLPSGGSVSFGPAPLGLSGDRLFTIKSLGAGSLNLTGSPNRVQLSGADASSFSVVVLPSSPLAPTVGVTNFTVRFSPSTTGSKSAVLTIPSNDPDVSTFTLNLSGSGRALPVLTLPSSPVLAEASGPSGAAVAFSATAKDADQTTLVPTLTPPSGSVFAIGDTIVNATVSDSAGGSTTGTFLVRVRDTTGPQITVPGNLSIEATGPTGAVVTFSVSANDLVDGPVSANASPSSGSMFSLGTTPVSVTAVDSRGNSRTSTFNVTVAGSAEISVDRAGTDIPIGGAEGFGTVQVGDEIVRTFTVRNSGPGLLYLTGNPPVVLSGSGAAAFTVTLQPASTVAALTGEATFSIRFAPSTGGQKTATVSLVNSDSDEANFSFTVTGAGNSAPSDITISPSAIDENLPSNSVVGDLVATDADTAQTHTFTLVSGTGDEDNARFLITQNKKLTLAESADFETKPQYRLRIAADDGNGGIFSKALTVSVNNLPELSVSGTLPGLDTTYGSISSVAFVTLRGSDLTGVITASAPAGFQLSLSELNGYASSITATPTGGAINGIPVYVRLAATTAPGSYSGPIEFSGGGAPAVSAALPVSTVSPKPLTLENAAVSTKSYDGTTAATITGNLSGIVGTDAVGFTGTGVFVTPNAGAGISVNTSIALTGLAASNYTIAQIAGLTGTIEKAAQTILFEPLVARVFGDGGFELQGSATSGLGVAFSSTSTNVSITGRNVTITGIGSAMIRASQPGNANFEPAAPVDQVFSVMSKGLTLENAAVVSKPYDGTAVATITGSLVGVVPGDNVTFTGTGTFASSDPGTGIPVTANITLGGTNAANYALSQPQGLTGTILSSSVSFGASVYRCSQDDSSVTLTLNRAGNGLAIVKLKTNDGTQSTLPPFSSAVAGGDYLDADGTVVTFADGQSSRTVTLTLVPKTASTTPNRRFDVVIDSMTGGSPGDISSASVEILASDDLKPSVVITAPGSATVVSDSPRLTLAGTAGDSRGLDRVEVVLNGASAVNAVLGSTANLASVPWSLEVQPIPGVNRVDVIAFDLSGNSTAATRSFTFIRRYPLVVRRSGPPEVSLDSAGTVTLVTSPSTNASPLSPSTANADPRVASIVPGIAVTLTAVAKPGYAFVSWSGLPNGAVVTGNVLTFSMPSAALEVGAVFQTADVFSGPPGSGNTFQGLILPEEGTDFGNATVGFLTGTLSAAGSFSGRIFVDGVNQAITATFFGDGSAVFTTGTGKVSSLSFGGRILTLSYNAGAGNDVITATLSTGDSNSSGAARRAIYSSANPVPQALLNSNPSGGMFTRGAFTIAFPAKAQEPGRSRSSYPQGAGYALLTLTDTGLLTGNGILADGSAFSLSSALVAGNVCPVFAQVTTPGQVDSVRGGSFLGTFVFDPTRADRDITGNGLLWIRPDVTGLTPSRGAAAVAAASAYTAGWPSGVALDGIGALYQKAATLQESLDLDGPSSDGNGGTLSYEDGKLVISDGKLSSGIAKQNFIVSGNTVTKLPATDASFTLTPSVSTGTFTGTFLPDWNPLGPVNPVFRGVLLQKGGSKGGYGFFVSNSTGDQDPESGSVKFTLEPNLAALIPVTSSIPSTISSTAPYVVTGIAGNVRGVSRVMISLNGRSPVAATLGAPSANGSVPYSLSVTPALGANTMLITAYDSRGNQTGNTVTFDFLRRFRLNLYRFAPTGVLLDSAGTVTMSVNPATQASLLLPTTASANPRSADVQYGSPVTLTATAKTGFAFLRWTGLPAGATVYGNTASFLMPTNNADIFAEFVAAPTLFTGPPGSGSVFYGLIRPESGTATSNSTVGFLTGSLNATTGVFTGTVFMDGLAQVVNITFHGDGNGVFNVGTTKQNSLSFSGKTLTLRLNVNTGSDQITARVTAVASTSSGVAQRTIYSSLRTVQPSLLNVGGNSGFATLVFPAKAQPQPSSTYPQGDGFASMTVTNTGAITLNGTLADNSTFTASTGLIKGDQAPFFAQILTPGSNSVRGGSFSGTLKFEPSQAASDVTGSGLLWIRPAVSQVAGTSSTALATQIYTDGWPGGLLVDALGALYTASQTVQISLGLPAANPLKGNAKLEFADGKLTTVLTKTTFNVDGNLVTKLPLADPSYTLTINPSTGSFSGSFLPNWAPTATTLPTFKGIILQKGSNRGGFGFFLSNLPSDTDPESGGLTLGKP